MHVAAAAAAAVDVAGRPRNDKLFEGDTPSKGIRSVHRAPRFSSR